MKKIIFTLFCLFTLGPFLPLWGQGQKGDGREEKESTLSKLSSKKKIHEHSELIRKLLWEKKVGIIESSELNKIEERMSAGDDDHKLLQELELMHLQGIESILDILVSSPFSTEKIVQNYKTIFIDFKCGKMHFKNASENLDKILKMLALKSGVRIIEYQHWHDKSKVKGLNLRDTYQGIVDKILQIQRKGTKAEMGDGKLVVVADKKPRRLAHLPLKDPIALDFTIFQECDECGGFPPLLRQKFREHVIDDIKVRIPLSQKVKLASFASGRLGMEFKILQELMAKGYRRIVLYVMDPKYAEGLVNLERKALLQLQLFAQQLNSKGLNIKIKDYSDISEYLRDQLAIKEEQRPNYFIDVDSGIYFRDENLSMAKNSLASGGVIKSLGGLHLQEDEEKGLLVRVSRLLTIKAIGGLSDSPKTFEEEDVEFWRILPLPKNFLKVK